MAIAQRDPEALKKSAQDETRVEAELSSSHSREGSTGQPAASERQGEGIRDYGRQGGSIIDTGTRTDDPVGVEQIESSAGAGQTAQKAREHQDSPPGKSAVKPT